MCRLRMLSGKDQTIISHCVGCLMVNIWHHHLLLTFAPEDFRDFKRLLDSFEFDEQCLDFPDGNDRIILNTPNADIRFAFTEEEFELFKETIQEAIVMSEVYDMMQ